MQQPSPTTRRVFAESPLTLRPQVTFCGEHVPTAEQIEHLHHQAHEECFIANSVKTEVRCEPVFPDGLY